MAGRGGAGNYQELADRRSRIAGDLEANQPVDDHVSAERNDSILPSGTTQPCHYSMTGRGGAGNAVDPAEPHPPREYERTGPESVFNDPSMRTYGRGGAGNLEFEQQLRESSRDAGVLREGEVTAPSSEPAMAIGKVALVGANGVLGPSVLQCLVADGFNVTVFKRASSSSSDEYHKSVHVTRYSDDVDVTSLSRMLKGQDAVVMTIRGNLSVQSMFAQASAQAEVQRFIPADFGSVDSSSSRAQKLVPLYRDKTALREELMRLAKTHSNFSWTSLVCGHFFDWDPEFLHIWPLQHRAEILDDGTVKWSAITLGQAARATSRVLQRPPETGNRVLYVQSFTVSQNEVIEAFCRSTGTTVSDWDIKRLASSVYEQDEKKKAESGDKGSVENLVWFLGTSSDANWEDKEGFAMEQLGLENESLDAAVCNILSNHA